MNARQDPVWFDPETVRAAEAAVSRADRAKPLWRRLASWLAAPVLILAVLAPIMPSLARWLAASEIALTPPDLALLASMPVAVQVHLASVVLALPLGGFILWRPKGTALHKALGRVWVAAMVAACISALFIESFAPVVGPFGFIHLLVIWTLIALGRGMSAIILHQDLKGHLSNMQGAWWGIVIAGLFSLIPGRLLWSMFTTM